MLRVNQILAVLLLLCTPMVWGQVFQAVPQRVMQAAGEDGLEWMQHCDPQSNEVGGIGIQGGGVTLSAAAQFSVSALQPYVGKSISVAAVYAGNVMSDASVFVLKGDDINKADKVSEVKVAHLEPGWNYVKLESPVTIDGSVALAVGYSAYDKGNFPLAFDGKRAKSNANFLMIEGQGSYSVAERTFGNLMVRALVGGDESQLGYSVVPNFVGQGKFLPKGEVDLALSLANNSFMPISDITIKFSVNGNLKEVPVTFEQAVPSNSVTTYTLGGVTLENDATLEVSVVKVNGKDNITANKLVKQVLAYDPEGAMERTILIEKFTGQNCGYCPGGESNIQLSIKGMEARVARIDHHYGFGNDMFTIEASQRIGNFYGVNSAPNCMVNRMVQDCKEIPDVDGEVVWHPGYMTAVMVADEISRPAYVSVNIDRTYDEATRELTVTVSGKATKDMVGKRLTVALTQSGYVAKQAGADANYRHNDFPVDFLTAYNGDELEWKADNTYEHTFKYVVKEKYGSVKADVDAMDVVAFVAGWGKNGNEGDVQNAAVKKVTDKSSASIQHSEIEENQVQISVSGSKFVVAGPVESVAVFTANGMQVENAGLSAGLYIVRVVSNGKVYVRKMILAD